MDFPNADNVRQRISEVSDIEIRMCLEASLLWCARISEVVAIPKPNEKVYGPQAKEVHVEDYEGTELAIFDVHTAKREGMIRKVAAPLKSCEKLYDYFQSFNSEESVFKFNRSKPLDYISRIQPIFKGLQYPIETYLVSKEGKLEKVLGHKREFRLHGLRHLRASELVERYGFDGFNLAAYGGWTIRTAQAFFGASIPSVMSRYLYLNWQGYIQKLLKR